MAEEETKNDYIILQRNTIEELQKLVNAKIKEKYMPYGNIILNE
jgi:hypothetical protein